MLSNDELLIVLRRQINFDKNKTANVHNVTLRRVLANHCFSGKAISTAYPDSVFVALGTQRECASAILSSVDSPTVLYLSTLSDKRRDLKKKILRMKCPFYFLYNFCLKHFPS